MGLADLPQVLKMEKASYSFPWSEIAFRQELRNEQATFVTLNRDNHIIGYSGHWDFVDQIHIGTIVSHPKSRRCGIGELLLIQIFIAAFASEAETITLEVRPSNYVAQGLYEKYGFEVVGHRKNYYPDNKEDALIMTTAHLSSPGLQSQVHGLAKRRLEQLPAANLDEWG
ncbi:MAG: ribosomal protein S18-alanine N-acetyltransferase [Chloroflexota bacterium]